MKHSEKIAFEKALAEHMKDKEYTSVREYELLRDAFYTEYGNQQGWFDNVPKSKLSK